MIHPRNVEGLAILNEECSEVQHIISKILRHGFDSYNPNDPHHTENTKLLQSEIGDLLHAIGLAVELFGLDKNVIGIRISKKSQEIHEYIHEIEIPDRNWIKDLIHHRDSTVGLLATDNTLEQLSKGVLDSLPLDSPKESRLLLEDYINKYLAAITFKID